MDEIKKVIPSVSAVLYGEGEEQENLLQAITSSSLQDTITLTGAMDHATIIARMQQSKILLHPSSYEGFSNVCLEALYAGAHVISFTRAMDTDIKNWHVVNSTEAIIAKAIELLTDKNTLFEKVAYHSFDDTAKKLAALFYTVPASNAVAFSNTNAGV